MRMSFSILGNAATALLIAVAVSACQYTSYPPRIDLEFKPGAPVMSDGEQFVVDSSSKSGFSSEELGEQLAFINQTLQEMKIGTIAPKTSNAVNRRYSVFVSNRMDRHALDAIVYRLQISGLVNSAEISDTTMVMGSSD